MYLKSLEIFGFKSFPEKTVLKFEPGITIIVGPNGCGKSNLFDAIKWALGEQSPKSLRGSKMEDVIFNGTQNYPPLNYTEVTLIFSNEDNYLPIDYREVAVTRRLYRSGESEYYLNKNLVRLKDIQNLFLGTGVGEATYSFIEQGKIEIFLSYKPEEKRVIFDEASGIIKYKERKKETIKKLEDTEQNLLRLEDIISEVTRQIRYLERQVEKARKFKEIEAQLIEAERKIASINYKKLERDINASLEELNKLKEEEAQREEEILSHRREIEKLTEKIKEVEGELEMLHSKVISSTSKIDLYKSHIEMNSQREEEARSKIEVIERELSQLKEKLLSQEERINQEKENTFSLDRELKSLSQHISTLKDKKVEWQKSLDSLSLEIEDTKQKILVEEAQRADINNELIEVNTYLKNLYSRKRRLLLDKERLNNIFDEANTSLSEISHNIEELNNLYLQLKRKKDELIERMKVYEKEKEELIQSKIEKEKELTELTSNYELLKDLRLRYEGISSFRKIKLTFYEEPSHINKLIISLKEGDLHKRGERGPWELEVEAKVIIFREEELKEKIDQLSQQIEKINNSLLQENENLEEIKKEWHQISNEISHLDKKLGEKIKEKDSVDREFLRVKEEFDLLNQEIETNLAEIRDEEKKKSNLEIALKNKETLLSNLEERLTSIQRERQSLDKELNSLEIDLTRKEGEIVSLRESKNSLAGKVQMLEEAKTSILASIEKLNVEKEENIKKIEALDKEISALQNDIARKEEEIETLLQNEKMLLEEKERLTKNKEEFSSRLRVLEDGLGRVKDLIYQKKLKIQELEFEKSKIADYLRQVYNLEFQLCEVEEDLDTLIKERDNLKKKLASLGEVNLVAIEEFDELNKRYQFLEEQRHDLINSKEELKKAISRINKTSREIFLEVFSKIKEEFKKNFRFLFGGGRAELVLLDESNILESGIEIEVQPPGKKLQNVSLLSGGEKALTAIALIFSIFSVRPSPLCVLDEIDAPLDEANVGRFNHLLKGFAQKSQFIIITHNKKTMSTADVLYGVTMEEKGISKIVSVKFAKEALS
ncbi:MAG: AAA family ATPase [Candidatus Omnitrophica bacterium]|nr:AAA family ATPase [Candidatus Omnitrophota bacterium]